MVDRSGVKGMEATAIERFQKEARERSKEDKQEAIKHMLIEHVLGILTLSRLEPFDWENAILVSKYQRILEGLFNLEYKADDGSAIKIESIESNWGEDSPRILQFNLQDKSHKSEIGLYTRLLERTYHEETLGDIDGHDRSINTIMIRNNFTNLCYAIKEIDRTNEEILGSN